MMMMVMMMMSFVVPHLLSIGVSPSVVSSSGAAAPFITAGTSLAERIVLYYSHGTPRRITSEVVISLFCPSVPVSVTVTICISLSLSLFCYVLFCSVLTTFV